MPASSGGTRFFIERPADKEGNTALPRAVVEARCEPWPGQPGRELLMPVAPPEVAARWRDGWPKDMYGGWAECGGPARMLTYEEWASLVASLARPED